MQQRCRRRAVEAGDIVVVSTENEPAFCAGDAIRRDTAQRIILKR